MKNNLSSLNIKNMKSRHKDRIRTVDHILAYNDRGFAIMQTMHKKGAVIQILEKKMDLTLNTINLRC